MYPVSTVGIPAAAADTHTADSHVDSLLQIYNKLTKQKRLEANRGFW